MFALWQPGALPAAGSAVSAAGVLCVRSLGLAGHHVHRARLLAARDAACCVVGGFWPCKAGACVCSSRPAEDTAQRGVWGSTMPGCRRLSISVDGRQVLPRLAWPERCRRLSISVDGRQVLPRLAWPERCGVSALLAVVVRASCTHRQRPRGRVESLPGWGSAQLD